MKLVICEQGHYYDADSYATCPHCQEAAVAGGPMGGAPVTQALSQTFTSEGNDAKTEALDSGVTMTGAALGESNVKTEITDPDDIKTVSYYGNSVLSAGNIATQAIPITPVVGWLVCIKGAELGKDYKIKAGRNFIGRNNDMDICIKGDDSISRHKHAIVIYDARSNTFLVQPGESRELFYLNGSAVLSAVEIKAQDVLAIGETELMMCPFCNDKFTWDSVKKDKED